MDGESTSEPEGEEGFTDQELENRLEDFSKLGDTAYRLFDGKYTMEQIVEMPYRVLILAMDRQQIIMEATAEERANKKVSGALQALGM